MTCYIVPPYLLRHLATARTGTADPGAERPIVPGAHPAADHFRRILEMDEQFRERRRTPSAVAATDGFTVHTADNEPDLPGRAVRMSGAPATGDQAVDEAHEGLAASLAMFAEVYAHDSWNGEGAHVLATVHFERGYSNAFWNGTQLVFGDGDGTIFDRFTKPVDVLAHELTHAVTESVAGLVYQGQSGSLNESMSDVFAACLKQRVLGQSAAEGDWLIGEGLFLPGVSARGLRDMQHPGTAYDDPDLGRDPQGADMSAYVVTSEDNGGVHLNSGIPNRAFVLAALAIGGASVDGAGQIWWSALGSVTSTVDFSGFADATIAAAGDHAATVRAAWADVGVLVEPARAAEVSGSANGSTDPEGATEFIEVRRSGGFVGRTVTGRCDLSDPGPHAEQVRSLLTRVDLRPQKPARSYPDMYSYVIRTHDREVHLAETQLSDDLRRLTVLVLATDTEM